MSEFPLWVFVLAAVLLGGMYYAIPKGAGRLRFTLFVGVMGFGLILMVDAVQNMPSDYERLDAKLPWCPESGLSSSEHKIGRGGLNLTIQVLQEHGFSQFEVQRRGVDGFWASSYRVVVAECKEAQDE